MSKQALKHSYIIIYMVKVKTLLTSTKKVYSLIPSAWLPKDSHSITHIKLIYLQGQLVSHCG